MPLHLAHLLLIKRIVLNSHVIRSIYGINSKQSEMQPFGEVDGQIKLNNCYNNMTRFK